MQLKQQKRPQAPAKTRKPKNQMPRVAWTKKLWRKTKLEVLSIYFNFSMIGGGVGGGVLLLAIVGFAVWKKKQNSGYSQGQQ